MDPTSSPRRNDRGSPGGRAEPERGVIPGDPVFCPPVPVFSPLAGQSRQSQAERAPNRLQGTRPDRALIAASVAALTSMLPGRHSRTRPFVCALRPPSHDHRGLRTPVTPVLTALPAVMVRAGAVAGRSVIAPPPRSGRGPAMDPRRPGGLRGPIHEADRGTPVSPGSVIDDGDDGIGVPVARTRLPLGDVHPAGDGTLPACAPPFRSGFLPRGSGFGAAMTPEAAVGPAIRPDGFADPPPVDHAGLPAMGRFSWVARPQICSGLRPRPRSSLMRVLTAGVGFRGTDEARHRRVAALVRACLRRSPFLPLSRESARLMVAG